MAWNDIDWLSVSRGGGFMESLRADKREAQTDRELQQRETAQVERQREFDARLPLLQYQIKTQADAQHDQTMLPILLHKTANQETTPEEAAPLLKTVAARQQYTTLTAQYNWIKARNNADASMLKDEAAVMTAYPKAKPALEQYPVGSIVRSEELQKWQERLQKEAAEKEIETFRQKQKIIGQERQILEDIRGGWRESLASIKAGGDATGVETMPDPAHPGYNLHIFTPPKGTSFKISEYEISPADKTRLQVLGSELRDLNKQLSAARAKLAALPEDKAYQAEVDSLTAQIADAENRLKKYAKPVSAPAGSPAANPAGTPSASDPLGLFSK